jgi:hypothetical protein
MEQVRKTEESTSQQMALEEARNVMWLRNKPEFYKPLGMLLDDGYLTRDRLKWAAENAYNPQLKQAASVILESLKQSNEERKIETSRTPGQAVALPLPSVNVDISIEEAQNIIWPFSLPPNCKGQPMGHLVNARQLVLKDLAYAIEKAWEKPVKQAATVLMLQRLNQTLNEPPPSTGPLRIVSGGRTFAERKQLQLSLLLGMLLGAITLVPILLLYVLLLPNLDRVNVKLLQTDFIKSLILFPFRHFELPQTTIAIKITAYVVIILITLIPVALITWGFIRIMNYITDRMWEKINNYRKGQEGENKVVEAIISNLDEEWALFRNISLPGRKKNDLDLILVGPPGVWVLEVKNFDGEYKNTGEDWEYRAGNIWKSPKKSPSRQVQNNALTLSNFLKADGIKQYVKPIVVWANEGSPLTVENPMVAVWQYNRLPEELGNIWQNQPIEQTQQKRIESKLTKLCQK